MYNVLLVGHKFVPCVIIKYSSFPNNWTIVVRIYIFFKNVINY